MNFHSLRDRLKRMLDAFSTESRRWFRGSDRARWSKTENLAHDWQSRTLQMARFIPEGAKVLEFGAGRMILRDHLPAGCTYIPSDLVDRGPGTIVCDLNDRQLPAFPQFDVAVFSGVLEYVHDVPRLITHLGSFGNTIVASYACADAIPSAMKRRSMGWVNDFKEQQLHDLFAKCGWHCQRRDQWADWPAHGLFEFKHVSAASAANTAITATTTQ